MMKKFFSTISLLSLFFCSSSYAAKFNLSDYLFKSQSKSGVFIGLDGNDNNANYYTNYYNIKSIISAQNKPYENLSIPDGNYSLTYGFRYYLPSKSIFLSRLGFGFKGWYSLQDNSVNRRYFGSGNTDEQFLLTSSVNSLGYEGQIHFDLLRFSPYKVNNSIGISFGAGYESKNYTNFHFGDKNTPPFSEIEGFKLNSVIYDASLYYNFANHLRFEIGYRLANFGSNNQIHTKAINNQNYTVETKVSPKNEYFYISTSFQF